MEAAAVALFEKRFPAEDGQEQGGKRALAEAGRVAGAVCAYAPGRVNLIGEHTDYNDGFVMPLALEKATVAVARLSATSRCRIVSALDADAALVEFTLDESSDSLVAGKDTSWAKYVKGVCKQYFEELVAAKPTAEGAREAFGFDMALASDVPLGGGLSSSASLEVCVATALEALYGVSSVDKVDRALRCVEAEHTFANVPCGIMDQFISSCAVEGCALLIDCRSRETTEVDMSDDSIRVVVINSNVKHELSGSEYPDRVAQCKKAAEAVQAKFGSDGKARTHLRDVTLEELEAVHADGALDEVTYKRARHGVSEDLRTTKAAKAAQAKDFAAVGKLMVESHNSLRDDYEVSVPEIDFLVETAVAQDGVFGSRITGGGFGGCTVSLVKTENVPAFEAAVQAAFKTKFGGKECTVFSTKMGPGARVLWGADTGSGSSSKVAKQSEES